MEIDFEYCVDELEIEKGWLTVYLDVVADSTEGEQASIWHSHPGDPDNDGVPAEIQNLELYVKSIEVFDEDGNSTNKTFSNEEALKIIKSNKRLMERIETRADELANEEVANRQPLLYGEDEI